MKTIRHEATAHSSAPLLKVRIKHGAEGYGVYFLLLELLALSRDCTLERDYEAIAYELHVSPGLVRSIVEDFGLFEIVGSRFGSAAVKPRSAARKKKAAPAAAAPESGPVFSQYHAEAAMPADLSTVCPQFPAALPEDITELYAITEHIHLKPRLIKFAPELYSEYDPQTARPPFVDFAAEKRVCLDSDTPSFD